MQWIKDGKGAGRGVRRSPIAVTFITRSSNDNGDLVAAAPCHRRPAVVGAAWPILMKEVGTLDKFGGFRWRRSDARLGRWAGRSFSIGRRSSDSRISWRRWGGGVGRRGVAALGWRLIASRARCALARLGGL